MKLPRPVFRTSSLVLLSMATASSGVSAAEKPLSAFAKEILAAHNLIRKQAPAKPPLAPLTWSPRIAELAQQWADRCEFRHPTSSSEQATYLIGLGLNFKLGQNLAMASGELTATDAVKMWGDEREDFKYGVETGKVVGHYTAIVWRKTTQLGCGVKVCRENTPSAFTFYVCSYGPVGNVYPNHLKPY